MTKMAVLGVSYSMINNTIEYYKNLVELECNPWVKWRIEKQIELLEDALVIYPKTQLPTEETQ